ncbi:amidohydrolase family protein [Agreia sp. Leaf244]|uniref:amidohydrolase family protein n=1 Tax=Agreia sp. Leaf244 TaxID=1736305 RepID=UPI001F41831A|nr:amidohydrolase family protein [Agreia sp. Leaf244]
MSQRREKSNAGEGQAKTVDVAQSEVMSSFTIDTHAHLAVPAVEGLIASAPGADHQRLSDAVAMGAASADVNRANMPGVWQKLTSIEERLEWMDRSRIDVQLVSPLPSPHDWADEDLAASIVSTTNAAVAEHCALAPERLYGIGTVALQHPSLAVEQLVVAHDAGLRGIQISTTAGPGRELDHSDLEPFWATAAELGMVVMIHPWGCSLGERLSDYYLFNTVGNPVETTLALSRIIFGGILERHPKLLLWAAHGGGYLGAYLGRSDHAWEQRPDAHTTTTRPSTQFRSVHVDALVYSDMQLRHLVESLGADQIMLGSDYPFDMGLEDPVGRLEMAGVPADAIEAIRGTNAAALFSIDRH